MYPNILVKDCKKALDFYMDKFDFCQKDREIVQNGFDVCKYGMERVLLRYKDVYYEYCGATEEKALCIGAYESAFFADLVVSWLFCKLEEEFKRDTVRSKVSFRSVSVIYFENFSSSSW